MVPRSRTPSPTSAQGFHALRARSLEGLGGSNPPLSAKQSSQPTAQRTAPRQMLMHFLPRSFVGSSGFALGPTAANSPGIAMLASGVDYCGNPEPQRNPRRALSMNRSPVAGCLREYERKQNNIFCSGFSSVRFSSLTLNSGVARTSPRRLGPYGARYQILRPARGSGGAKSAPLCRPGGARLTNAGPLFPSPNGAYGPSEKSISSSAVEVCAMKLRNHPKIDWIAISWERVENGRFSTHPSGPNDELFERAEVRTSATEDNYQLVEIYCQDGMVGRVVGHNAETAQKLCKLLNQRGLGKTINQICDLDVDTDLTS